jgi:hypothetical protein
MFGRRQEHGRSGPNGVLSMTAIAAVFFFFLGGTGCLGTDCLLLTLDIVEGFHTVDCSELGVLVVRHMLSFGWTS